MGLTWDKTPDLADRKRYWDMQLMSPLTPVPTDAYNPGVSPAPRPDQTVPSCAICIRHTGAFPAPHAFVPTGVPFDAAKAPTPPRPDQTAEILDLLRDIKNELRLLRLDTGR